MSTRATYGFITPDYNIEFYIHHDGYPEGAADYFKSALEHCKNHEVWGEDNLADSFHRVNDRSRFTKADLHGDTEFHYEVFINPETDRPISLNAYSIGWDEARTKTAIFSGTLEDFIKKYGN